MASLQKKQKTAESNEEVEVVEEATEPDTKAHAKELEEDAKKDTSAKIKETVTFLTPDTTLNVLPSTVGNMLSCLQDGGLGNLVAGARASVGVKSGRYMFEAKIVEQTKSGGKPFFRVGFASEGNLFLGEDDSSICFDSEGFMVSNKKKIKCSMPFSQDTMVAVVINLDLMSPNANTISFFRDGVRVAQPQALPDALKDRTLFPAFSFKNSTIHYNFGAPVVPLPFKCKVLQEAATKDVAVTKYDVPADGKYEVLFPVSLPDEGSFEWLDSFLLKNPGFTELSDRALLDWSIKSGVQSKGKPASNDKPDASGDNANLRKILMQLATLQPRNCVVMEVKGNLVKEERAAALAKFKNPVFKIMADVIVGEPPSSFKKIVQQRVLKAKQDASDIAFKAKQLREKQEWTFRVKKKELEKQKKKAEKERAKKLEEVKKATEKAKKDALAKKVAAEGKPVEEGQEEEKEDEKKAEVPEEEEPEEPDEPEPVQQDPPEVELTDEEKQIRFFKNPIPDLTTYDLSTSFTKFTIPEAKEGFDTVRFSWSKEKPAIAYMKEWVLERKLTTRVEDLIPSEWFKEKAQSWTAALNAWKNKQNEYKAEKSKKAAERAAKAASKAAQEKKEKMLAEKKAKEAEAQKEKGSEDKEQDDVASATVEVEEEPAEVDPVLDFDSVDVFGVDDVCDIGSKTPLFKDFQYEDYALMGLRAELHLMAHAFSKDVDDPDRTGMHVDHVTFYYQKYFNKSLSPDMYGVKTPLELMQLVRDTIYVGNNHVVESLIPADLETHSVFVKLTEEARRQRMLALEMGDEAAKLKIQQHGQNNSGHKKGEQGKGEKQGKGDKRQWEGGHGKGDGKKGKWGSGWKRW